MKVNFSGTVVNVPPTEEDVYTVEVTSTEETKTTAGNDRIRIHTIISSGAGTSTQYAGCTINDGFNLPNSGRENVDAMMLRLWMSFLVSTGFSQDELRKRGDFDFGKLGKKGAFENVVGKVGYCRFLPSSPDEGRPYPKITWMSPAQAGAYTAAKASTQAAVTSNNPLDDFLSGK